MRHMRRAGAIAGVIALGAASILVATPAMADSQVPADCAFNAPSNGYVVTDPATNSKCVTNENGTYMFVKGAVKKRCQVSAFVSSFRVIQRGDTRPFVTYRFIRGKTVVVKKVRLRPGKKAVTSFRFTRSGKWTVVSSYGGKRLTATVRVNPGGSC